MKKKKMNPPALKNLMNLTPKKNLDRHYIFSFHGNGDSIRIGWEIQFLPHAEFFKVNLKKFIFFSFFYLARGGGQGVREGLGMA